MQATKRAAIYVRLSVYRGETDPSLSPATQEEECRAYAKAKGWEVVDVIQDLDVSGSDKGLRLDRPGLKRVRAIFPEIDVLIIAKLNRLTRNVVDFGIFVEEAKAHGVALVSNTENLDLTTEMGRFSAQILAAFAEMEAATIASRVRTARAAMAEAGRYGGGGRPYGYRSAPHPSGVGRILEPDSVEAPIVREIAERLIAGQSMVSIARDLNRREIPTRRRTRKTKDGGEVPTRWHTTTIGDLIRTPGVTGRLVHRGEVVVDDAGQPVQAWEPVLDVATWRQAVKAIEPKIQPGSAPRARAARMPKRMLSGLAYCGSCNHRMSLRGFRGQGIYACNAKSNGHDCPRGVTILADRLEATVSDEYLRLFGDLPMTIIEETANAESVEALALAEEALDSLLARLRDVDDEDEEEVLLAKRRKIRATLPSLQAAAKAVAPRLIETGVTVRQEWALRDGPGRHSMISEAIDHFVVLPAIDRSTKFDPRRVELHWAPDPVEAAS